MITVFRYGFSQFATRQPARQFKTNKRIGFLGAGQMAQAIAIGLQQSKSVEGEQIALCDKTANAFPNYKKFGFQMIPCGKELVDRSQILFLCVKPSDFESAFQTVVPLDPRKMYVSIAAGITLQHMFTLAGEKMESSKSKMIQLMPNTPCLVGEGAGAFLAAPSLTTDEIEEFKNLLRSSMPILEQVDSTKQMDAVTGVAGSGPAYIFTIAEAMAEAGVKQGLPWNLSLRLALQTIKGSAVILQNTGDHPAVLKMKVCSPGGTTAAALHELDNGSFRATLMNAVEAATLKASTL
ncbi:Pyrroline-5-carboxylate reductase 1, mitochondrial [Cichlidogyrus casuarinus]|uniref:Pyrroline-5-carboxylate reductase n=1 Tax=Cichlidogyrus casuarinus TaxID=1844966 RepID=A0ABD2QDF4_9PLAT